MARVIIREAAPSDAADMHAVLLAAFTPFRDQYTAGCFDATVLDPNRLRARMEEGPLIVATVEDHIVGTVGVKLDARGAYIRGLGVHPEARRAGIGRLLMEACQAWARTQGATTAWLSTTLFLDGSISLYHALGYEDAPGPDDLFGTPLRSFERPLA